MALKVVAFDNYGTLEDIHTDERPLRLWRTTAHFMRLHGAYWDPKALRKAFRAGLDRQSAAMAAQGMDAPEPDLAVTLRELYAAKGVSADDALITTTAQVFRTASTDYFDLYPGTRAMLERLKAAGLRVALLSNAQRLFTEPELRALGLWDVFDQIFISSDCGCKKPSAAFYGRLIAWAGVPAEEIMMVGNSPRDDILPANALGLKTFYTHSALTEQDAVKPESTLYLPDPDMQAMGDMILELL